MSDYHPPVFNDDTPLDDRVVKFTPAHVNPEDDLEMGYQEIREGLAAFYNDLATGHSYTAEQLEDMRQFITGINQEIAVLGKPPFATDF